MRHRDEGQSAAFRESHVGGLWLRVVGILAASLSVAAIGVSVAPLIDGWGSPASASLLAGLLLLALVGGVGFTTLIWNTTTIIVEDGVLVARLQPLRVLRIPLDAIDVVTETTVSPAEALGLGLRWTPNGSYLLWGAGTAVRLRTREGRVVHLQTDRAEELHSVLVSAGATGQSG